MTCEHATWRAPARTGLDPAVCRTHVGWDRGAAPLARSVARALGVTPLLGSWTRLYVDLNRSADHPGVVPTRTFGVDVPANALPEAARLARIRGVWAPFRARARKRVARAIARAGHAVHLSIHSFDPSLDPATRAFDVGVLFDPSRPAEAAFAARLLDALRARGLDARPNAPYLGTDDGHTTALRAVFPDPAYVGVEVELSQGAIAASGRVAGAIVEVVRGAPHPPSPA